MGRVEKGRSWVWIEWERCGRVGLGKDGGVTGGEDEGEGTVAEEVLGVLFVVVGWMVGAEG